MKNTMLDEKSCNIAIQKSSLVTVPLSLHLKPLLKPWPRHECASLRSNVLQWKIETTADLPTWSAKIQRSIPTEVPQLHCFDEKCGAYRGSKVSEVSTTSQPKFRARSGARCHLGSLEPQLSPRRLAAEAPATTCASPETVEGNGPRDHPRTGAERRGPKSP